MFRIHRGYLKAKEERLITVRNIYLSGLDKKNLQKFQVHFNNLTLEANKKQLKVAS